MHRSLALFCGTLSGGAIIAMLDAGLTGFAPIIASFLPVSWYLASMGLFGAAALIKPSRRWRWIAALLFIGGIAGGTVMMAEKPMWDSKVGWQSCRLIAGPWYLRSPYPVRMPGCGILSMCANESHYDTTRLMKTYSCPAP